MEHEWPKRKDIRLKNYDYSSAGAYYVTICIQDRKRILSEIVKPHLMGIGERTVSDVVGEGLDPPAKLFQRSYMEHIIRDKADYETKRKYIYENPIRWYYRNLESDK